MMAGFWRSANSLGGWFFMDGTSTHLVSSVSVRFQAWLHNVHSESFVEFWAPLVLILILACFITSVYFGDSVASWLLLKIILLSDSQFFMVSPKQAITHPRQLQADKVYGRLPEEGDKVTRFDGIKFFHDHIVVLLMFMEPISNMLTAFPHRGSYLLDSLVEVCLQSFGEGGSQAPTSKRVRSRDLKSVQFLGQGFSGLVYKTAWYQWHGARKDFPGVERRVFETEAGRLVNLEEHPNLVKVLCWTVDRSGCSLVMEYVNTDLRTVVETRKEAHRRESASSLVGKSVNRTWASPLDPVEAIYIMLHIASAMEYLHSEGVGHGDLRPNNVLVDVKAKAMTVKVVDYGLSGSKKTSTLVSKRAQFVRTLEWKAPETWPSSKLLDSPDEYVWEEMDSAEVEGRARVADEPGDVYSFAATCAYILGGRVSYPKSGLSRLQQQISSGTLRPEIPSTCPKPVKKLIESSWDSDPGRRPGFSELRKQLEEILKQATEHMTLKFNHKQKTCGMPEYSTSVHMDFIDSLQNDFLR